MVRNRFRSTFRFQSCRSLTLAALFCDLCDVLFLFCCRSFECLLFPHFVIVPLICRRPLSSLPAELSSSLNVFFLCHRPVSSPPTLSSPSFIVFLLCRRPLSSLPCSFTILFYCLLSSFSRHRPLSSHPCSVIVFLLPHKDYFLSFSVSHLSDLRSSFGI